MEEGSKAAHAGLLQRGCDPGLFRFSQGRRRWRFRVIEQPFVTDQRKAGVDRPLQVERHIRIGMEQGNRHNREHLRQSNGPDLGARAPVCPAEKHVVGSRGQGSFEHNPPALPQTPTKTDFRFRCQGTYTGPLGRAMQRGSPMLDVFTRAADLLRLTAVYWFGDLLRAEPGAVSRFSNFREREQQWRLKTQVRFAQPHSVGNDQ
jgi:hypothetical protein